MSGKNRADITVKSIEELKEVIRGQDRIKSDKGRKVCIVEVAENGFQIIFCFAISVESHQLKI